MTATLMWVHYGRTSMATSGRLLKCAVAPRAYTVFFEHAHFAHKNHGVFLNCLHLKWLYFLQRGVCPWGTGDQMVAFYARLSSSATWQMSASPADHMPSGTASSVTYSFTDLWRMKWYRLYNEWISCDEIENPWKYSKRIFLIVFIDIYDR